VSGDRLTSMASTIDLAFERSYWTQVPGAFSSILSLNFFDGFFSALDVTRSHTLASLVRHASWGGSGASGDFALHNHRTTCQLRVDQGQGAREAASASSSINCPRDWIPFLASIWLRLVFDCADGNGPFGVSGVDAAVAGLLKLTPAALRLRLDMQFAPDKDSFEFLANFPKLGPKWQATRFGPLLLHSTC